MTNFFVWKIVFTGYHKKLVFRLKNLSFFFSGKFKTFLGGLDDRFFQPGAKNFSSRFLPFW